MSKNRIGAIEQNGQPTLTDVAVRAGVSIGTVSRVLNERRGVNAALKARVEAALRDLNYSRPVNARRAARESCPILTFILSNRDFLHPVHARLLQGAEEYCEGNGYFLIFNRLSYSPLTPASELLLPVAYCATPSDRGNQDWKPPQTARSWPRPAVRRTTVRGQHP